MLRLHRSTVSAVIIVAMAAPLAAADARYLQELWSQRAKAEDSESRTLHRSRAVWLASLAVFVAANILDAHSSWGKPEANVLLRGAQGRFDGRSAAVKSAILGSVIAGEYAVTHMRGASPDVTRSFYLGTASANFMTAGFLSRTIYRNYQQPVPPPTPARAERSMR